MTTIDALITEKEVLREYATSISAAFLRYMRKNNIPSSYIHHPINASARLAWQMADKALACQDFEQVSMVKQTLDGLKQSLLEIDPSAVV